MKTNFLIFILLSIATYSFADEPGVWQNYQNKDYGFSIKYPPDVKIQQQFSTAYFVHGAWSMNNPGSPDNNASQHSLIEIPIDDGRGPGKDGSSYYYQAYLRIGVSKVPADLASCEDASNNFVSASPAKTQINDHTFYLFTFSDAAMSQFGAATLYRAVNKNVCYSLEFVEDGSNNIPEFESRSAKNKKLAEKMIDTFMFQ